MGGGVDDGDIIMAGNWVLIKGLAVDAVAGYSRMVGARLYLQSC